MEHTRQKRALDQIYSYKSRSPFSLVQWVTADFPHANPHSVFMN